MLVRTFVRISQFPKKSEKKWLAIFVKRILRKLILRIPNFWESLFQDWQKSGQKKELEFAPVIREN